MADLIKVNTKRLKSDQEEIREHISAIEKLITDLRSHNNTLDNMWDGPSSEAFKTNFEKDIEALEMVCKALAGINEYEKNAGSMYDACEHKVGQLVDQIRI